MYILKQAVAALTVSEHISQDIVVVPYTRNVCQQDNPPLGVPIFTALGGSQFQASGFTGGHD